MGGEGEEKWSELFFSGCCVIESFYRSIEKIPRYR